MSKKPRKLSISGGSIVRVTISGIIIAVVVVSFYYMVSHRLSSHEEVYETEAVSELEEVLSQDFLNHYPDSPRAVVEWYNRILTLYYSDDISRQELEGLVDQARMLLDQEILAANPRTNHVAAVLQDREKYQTHSRRISSSTVIREVSNTKGRDSLAGVMVMYTVQEKSTYTAFYQTYNLKRDGAGRYKIHTFSLTDESGNPNVGSGQPIGGF